MSQNDITLPTGSDRNKIEALAEQIGQAGDIIKGIEIKVEALESPNNTTMKRCKLNLIENPGFGLVDGFFSATEALKTNLPFNINAPQDMGRSECIIGDGWALQAAPNSTFNEIVSQSNVGFIVGHHYQKILNIKGSDFIIYQVLKNIKHKKGNKLKARFSIANFNAQTMIEVGFYKTQHSGDDSIHEPILSLDTKISAINHNCVGNVAFNWYESEEIDTGLFSEIPDSLIVYCKISGGSLPYFQRAELIELEANQSFSDFEIFDGLITRTASRRRTQFEGTINGSTVSYKTSISTMDYTPHQHILVRSYYRSHDNSYRESTVRKYGNGEIVIDYSLDSKGVGSSPPGITYFYSSMPIGFNFY
ncbi:hypothetical protein DYA89_09570 [Vibrio cholerae]|uniref:hypothetical protein n=1 Tax=Vibrio cholerae TaxID=666 RepID=UPI0011D60BCB|nr:hypothetical protein [Vibrio cholerae]EGR2459869.1 hypothetical protein [Vibrio cholerae]TYA58339.1 hypothetical protein FXE55_07280 [Vibrio cholerae]GHW56541.1 hypothetical protein VCSRO57_2843 [Vibrio cholerae]